MSEPDNAFKAAWWVPSGRGSEGQKFIVTCRPGGEVLVPEDAPVFPDHPFFEGDSPEGWEYLGIGHLSDTPVLLASAFPDSDPPPGYEWRSVRTLFAGLDPAMVDALSRAAMLATWDADHRYCGRCGTSMARNGIEAARVCDSCGYRSYPRISPAMIVLIEASPEAGFNEPRILLGHNRRFPDGVYSCIAGYVDAGETLEATVRREVMEEVGLEAGEVSYVRSQSWPLPHSLMLGFNTTAAGDPIPDGEEISDARWFPADGLPHIPRHGTIARTLIDDWLERVGAEPYDDRYS